MECKKHLFLVILTGILAVVDSNAYVDSKADELYTTIVSGHNKDIRPCIGCGTPLEINITFHLTSLNDLDEVAGEMNSIGYLTVMWIDDRVTWNPSDYGGIASMQMPVDKVWTPRLLVANPSKKISTLNGDVVLVRVMYNGLRIWNPGEVFLTKCYPDIYRYPYDAQECYISIVPWGSLASEIMLNCPTSDILTPFYVDNGEWILQKTNANAFVQNGLPMAKFIFTYSRRPQFFVVNVILPIVLLSYLNCLVFVIPTQSGERVSYSITVLLSFAVFMTLVGDNIPKTSDPMSLLCYYLISIFSGSTLVMLSTIFNLGIFHRDPTFPVTAAYKTLVMVTSRQFGRKRQVAPLTPASSSSTLVTIIELEPRGKMGQRDTMDDCLAAEVNKLHNAEEDEEHEITWIDVSKCLDTISMAGFLFFFTAATVIQLMFIAIPPSL